MIDAVKSTQPCEGCGREPVVFVNLKTSERLCPNCTCVDAGAMLPGDSWETDLADRLAHLLSAPRRLFGRGRD